MQELMWSEPVSHNVFFIYVLVNLEKLSDCVWHYAPTRTHKWNDPWFGMTDTYIYIYITCIFYIFYFIYILYILFYIYILYIYIYLFVCSILKHLLNTDNMLVKNGTCISNAVSVSSRKCSI